MLLADMGADVVKVESPDGGDPLRGLGEKVKGFSWYFASFNRNKRSISLDLKTEEGNALLKRMLGKADVLVENFRPGVLDRLGFTERRLADINPNLVVASINGFGSKGRYAQRPAFDFVVQAMSGFMSMNGKPDGEPLRTGVPIADIMAGIYAAFGVVCALRTKGPDGTRGQRLEVSMLSALMSSYAWYAADYFAAGRLPARTGNDHPISAPYGLFQARDGQIAVAPSTDQIVQRFMNAIGLGELLLDPRFHDNASRVKHRPMLQALIDQRISQETQERWVETLNSHGVPCSIVRSLDQVMSDTDDSVQDMVLEVDHGDYGPVKMLGFPIKLSQTPCKTRLPAPDYGAHHADIYRDWELSD